MDIFTEVKKLNFPKGEYIVVGSGIMAAKGIRDTSDLDIIVTPELFKRCKLDGWEVFPWTKESIPGKDWLKKDSVELYIQLSRKEGGILAEELLKDAEIIEDVPFINWVTLMDFKEEYGRSKDFEDIKLIQEYLAK